MAPTIAPVTGMTRQCSSDDHRSCDRSRRADSEQTWFPPESRKGVPCSVDVVTAQLRLFQSARAYLSPGSQALPTRAAPRARATRQLTTSRPPGTICSGAKPRTSRDTDTALTSAYGHSSDHLRPLLSADQRRVAAASCSCAIEDDLANWATHSDIATRIAVAGHPNVPLIAVRRLALDDRMSVQRALIENGHATSHVAQALGQCARDLDGAVRLAAALHPRTPWEALESLAHDPDPEVRRHAQENLGLQWALGRASAHDVVGGRGETLEQSRE
ncbi:hypothetical protein [Demequina sp.]|uniref:hypothetical protein n=1 Tax=Demequina sp. TaxID=2050685 RepID=UPI003A89176D